MHKKLLVFSVVAIMLSCNLFAQGKAKLLYKGRYSCSSSSCGAGGLGSGMVTIYDDEIYVSNDRYGNLPSGCYYERTTDNGTRVYRDGYSGSFAVRIYVDRNYNIYSTQGDCRYNWTKGESAMPQPASNNGGGGSNRGTHGSEYQSPYKEVTETCGTCKGKGRMVYNTYPTMYGNDYKKYCSECGQYFMASTGHSHITCTECHGSGKVKRMRRR